MQPSLSLTSPFSSVSLSVLPDVAIVTPVGQPLFVVAGGVADPGAEVVVVGVADGLEAAVVVVVVTTGVPPVRFENTNAAMF